MIPSLNLNYAKRIQFTDPEKFVENLKQLILRQFFHVLVEVCQISA